MKHALWLFLLTSGLLAETPLPGYAVGPFTPTNVRPFGAKSPIGIDEGYLDDKKEVAPPTVSKGSITGKDRYFGPEPEYNTVQREEWIRTCQEAKKRSLQAFRECFENEKQKTVRMFQDRQNAVEQKQAQPLRNSPMPR